MVKVELGKVYRASFYKEGQSSRGPWRMVKVDAESGSQKATLWVVNELPGSFCEGCEFRLDKIVSFTVGKRKDQQGNWIQNDSCEVEITPIESKFENNSEFAEFENQFETSNFFATDDFSTADDETGLPF